MKKYYFFLVFIYCIPIYGIIVEHSSINSILDYVNTSQVLVVFDIDNTLATTAFEIGNDQWFTYLVEKKQKEGFSLEEAINLSLPLYFYVAFKIPLIPVELETTHVITMLLQKNVPILALTARSIFIAEHTLEQLANIHITFSIPSLKQQELFLTLPTHIPSMYKNGILFSGNNDKGKVLLEFFRETNYWPKKVIFIDDKIKYLENVEKILNSVHIAFLGIHYTGSNERVKQFDPQKAEYQLRLLKSRELLIPPLTNYVNRFFYWIILTVLSLFFL